MTRWTKCRSCSQYTLFFKHYCNYECSKKGNKEIIPRNFTMMGIKKALENNIGISISHANISKYSREIEVALNG